MPKGPGGERGTADAIGDTAHVVRSATGDGGEVLETVERREKDPAAAAMGRKGGAARAARMTAERRAEIARKAATARWRKDGSSPAG